MALGTDRMENAEIDRLYQEVSGHLGRARALLAMAHRYAAKMPLVPEDQEKSRNSLSEAIGLCVTATHAAKANNLYRLPDSGLNPSELRHSVQRALTEGSNSRPSSKSRRPSSAIPAPERASASLFAQLNACRGINVEGLRWLSQLDPSAESQWRGAQLLKIAEQLCVSTALESKLLGLYVLGNSRQEPSEVRKTVNYWAGEATRRELAEE